MTDTILRAVAAGAAMFAAAWWIGAALAGPSRARRELLLGIIGARPTAPMRPAGDMLDWQRFALPLVPTVLRQRVARSVLARAAVRKRLERWVIATGADPGAASGWLEATVSVAVIAMVTGVVVGATTGAASAVLVGLAAATLAAALSLSHLTSLGRTRRERIARDLPLAIDVIAAGLKAGAPLDRAMAAYAVTSEGELSHELRRVLADLEAGYRRVEAYARLAARVDLGDIRRLTADLVRAQEQGTLDPAELRATATDIRARQRQVIQARAMRAPITMLFPIAAFIMPAMFLIVLGPVVVGLVTGSLFGPQ